MKNPHIIDRNKSSRKIYYEIEFIGGNVVYRNDNGNMFIKLREMKSRYIVILIHCNGLQYNDIEDNILPINGSFKKLKDQYVVTNEDYYILMMAADSSNKIKCDDDNFSFAEIKNIMYSIPNQIPTGKEKHFGSGGNVYSLGYTAKYKIENDMSFGAFVTSKLK